MYSYDLKTANYYIDMIKKHNYALNTNKKLYTKLKVSERFFYYFKKGQKRSKPVYLKLEKMFKDLKRFGTWVGYQSDINYGNVVVVFGDDSAEELKDKTTKNGDIIKHWDVNEELREYFFINEKYGFKQCKYIVDSVIKWMDETEEELDNILEFYDLMLSKTSAPKTLRKYLLRAGTGFIE